MPRSLGLVLVHIAFFYQEPNRISAPARAMVGEPSRFAPSKAHKARTLRLLCAYLGQLCENATFAADFLHVLFLLRTAGSEI
jgi:hypothetical protein